MATNNRLWKPNAEGQSKRDFRVIKNSEVIMVGDWITDEGTGCADLDATTEKVSGLCVSIVTKDKRSLESATVSSSDYTGTYVASTKQYTASATNADSGGDGVMAEFIPVKAGDQFLAKLDAAKGTTTGSNLRGYNLAVSLSDASLLDESTASTSDASTQFRIVDPNNQGATTEVVVEVIARETEQQSLDA